MDEYYLISEQLQNDPLVSTPEIEELDRLINRYMSVYNKFDMKVVNSVSLYKVSEMDYAVHPL